MLKFLRSDKFVLITCLGLFLFGMLTHCLTLSFSPLPWFDEVEIAEMVRDGIVHSPSEYGLHYYCLNEQMNGQSWALFYVGGWLQNLAYNIFGSLGPRISSLLSLLLLTLSGTYYAWRRTSSVKFSSFFSIMLFSFPIVVQSVRAARVDVWAMALLFVVLALLERFRDREGRSNWGVPLICGGMAALSIFVWITAVFFVPIYMWAFIEYSGGWRKSVRTLFWGLVGGVFVSVVLLLPFLRCEGAFDNFYKVLTSVSGANQQSPDRWNALLIFIHYLFAFPFVSLVGGIALLLGRKNAWLKVGVLIYILLCVGVCASMYVYRFIYFVPYAFVGLTVFFVSHAKVRKVMLCLCFVLSVFCYVRGVIVRNGVEYLTKEGRSRETVQKTMEQHFGHGASVYCMTRQLYYIGRSLHWRQFSFVEGLVANPQIIDTGLFEWFIGEEQLVSKLELEYLERHGYSFDCKIVFTTDMISPFALKILRKLGRSLTYGPYVVYRRNVD